MEKYYRVNDVKAVLKKLAKEPAYQHDGEDFYEDEVSLLIDGYSRSEENFANLSELVTTITYDIILFNDILENMKK